MWDKKSIEKLKAKLEASKNGGGEQRIAKQHEAGKMTARERIDYLFDKDTFVEVGGLESNRFRPR